MSASATQGGRNKPGIYKRANICRWYGLHEYRDHTISCRWGTRLMRCITATVLQTKVDAQGDKLATELRVSWQPLRRSTFSSYSELFIQSRPFQPILHRPTCIWRLRWEWARLRFAQIFGVKKLESLGYIVWHRLRDPTFGRFNRTPICDLYACHTRPVKTTRKMAAWGQNDPLKGKFSELFY